MARVLFPTLALFGLLQLLPVSAGAQAFLIPKSFDRATIPFEYINGFIVVTMTVNDRLPLRFVFDTGAEHTILLQPEMARMLGMRYTRVFDIRGSDLLSDRKAYLVRMVDLKCRLNERETLEFPYRSVLVLEEDYFRFESYAGTPIHGILGADIFSNFTVRIDFRRREIRLYRPGDFRPGDRFEALPVDIYRNKAYLHATTGLVAGDSIAVKLLVDSGAALPLLLYTETSEKLTLPETVIEGMIGSGIGGELSGFLGRMEHLRLGTHHLERPVTNFQRLPLLVDTSLLNQRQGILGSRLLEQFEVVLDYREEMLYLRRYRQKQRRRVYDRSGLVVTAGGEGLREFYVHWIISGSPAAEADLQPGDLLVSVNGTPVGTLGLAGIRAKLRKKAGKRVRLKVWRDGYLIKTELILRELI